MQIKFKVQIAIIMKLLKKNENVTKLSLNHFVFNVSLKCRVNIDLFIYQRKKTVSNQPLEKMILSLSFSFYPLFLSLFTLLCKDKQRQLTQLKLNFLRIYVCINIFLREALLN